MCCNEVPEEVRYMLDTGGCVPMVWSCWTDNYQSPSLSPPSATIRTRGEELQKSGRSSLPPISIVCLYYFVWEISPHLHRLEPRPQGPHLYWIRSIILLNLFFQVLLIVFSAVSSFNISLTSHLVQVHNTCSRSSCLANTFLWKLGIICNISENNSNIWQASHKLIFLFYSICSRDCHGPAYP